MASSSNLSQRAQICSLVRELRSHKPHSTAKKMMLFRYSPHPSTTPRLDHLADSHFLPLTPSHSLFLYWVSSSGHDFYCSTFFSGLFSSWHCQGKHNDWNRPPWPSTIVTICMSCFMTGGPGKEHRTNKPPPTRRVQERSKGDTTCPTTSQNPSLWHPFGWTKRAPPGRTLTQNDWLKMTWKLIPWSWNPRLQAMWQQSSWVPLPYCFLPRGPFQIKSLALSAHVSPWTIHFQVLDKSPVSSPGRGPPSCSNSTYISSLK